MTSSAGFADSAPICTLTGTALPSVTGVAGTTTLIVPGSASLTSATIPLIDTVSGLPSRFDPLMVTSSPGIATSGWTPLTWGAR